MGGKLDGQRLAAVAPGRLIHLVDEISGDRFLVDTGAAFSVFPHHATTSPCGPTLRGPNGYAIPCWGEKQFTLIFSGRQFKWKFLMAGVDFPIIGIDFLRYFGLIINPAKGTLHPANGRGRLLTVAACLPAPSPVSTTTGPQADPARSIAGASTAAAEEEESGGQAVSPPPRRPLADPCGSIAGATSSPPAQPASFKADKTLDSLPKLLTAFGDVLNAAGRLPPSTHGVLHHIVTTGPPVTAKFRRLEGAKLAAAKKEFAELEKEGIVRRSDSCWSSPLHMVEKADKTWRPCGDFRRLNLVSAADRYPVPNMEDLTAQLAGTHVYSKLDLKKGYHQIPVNPEDIPKTAIITPFGLFEFIRMPFGLKNAGMTFQRFMDQLFGNLSFTFVYLDDILIASADTTSHLVHLQETLHILRSNGLVLNKNKCQFMQKEVDYLGHKISAAGISPLTSGVQAVASYPQPNTVKELQGFLGLVNFYRRFLPAAAHVLLPLTDTLRGGRAGAEKLDWSEDMKNAFTTAKAAVSSAASLAHPSPTAELVLVTDASDSHVGAVLQQRERGSHWQPLSFFSKKLEPAQQKYSAFDRELFAVFASIRHFRHQLEGQIFAVWTDHKPLVSAIHRVSEPWTARHQRQLSYIAEYTNQLVHVPGVQNVVADALSRPPQTSEAASTEPASGKEAGVIERGCERPHVPRATPPGPTTPSISSLSALQPLPGMDYKAVAAAQASCEATCRLRASPSLKIQDVALDSETLWCDVSTGKPRPLIPEVFKREIFKLIHNLAHPSIRATRRMIAARVVWRGLATDVTAWCRDCQHCQRAKVTRQPKAALQEIKIPARRFSHIHVDIVGPLPVSARGFSHVFTMVDRSTRWVEAVPLLSTSTEACVEAVLTCWVARFGVPALLTSDRGVQFTSAVWSALCHRLGISHITTTAYHPQANGMVERFHRQLKNSLRARLAASSWPEHLPWVLLGLRSAPKEDSGISSAELVYGAPLTLPGEFLEVEEQPTSLFLEKLRTAPSSIPTRPQSYAEAARSPPKALREAAYVYVQRGSVAPPLTPLYQGPYAVSKRGPKFFSVEVGGRTEVITVDRLKPHLGPAPITPAQPPRRGRPPTACPE